jgi:hypothetical protein
MCPLGIGARTWSLATERAWAGVRREGSQASLVANCTLTLPRRAENDRPGDATRIRDRSGAPDGRTVL